MLLGIEDQISGSIAYEAEFPDGVVTGNQYAERYSWMKKEDQKDTHVLNGRYGPDVTKETVTPEVSAESPVSGTLTEAGN